MQIYCYRLSDIPQIEETMQALHDVVQAGYVRYIGISSCWAWQFHAMQSKYLVGLNPQLRTRVYTFFGA